MLKAPWDLQYQLAFLSHELREIFAAAPLSTSTSASGCDNENSESNRKIIEGDCPICFMDFSPETEEIVYCKAACGNNIHQSCFEVRWSLLYTSDNTKPQDILAATSFFPECSPHAKRKFPRFASLKLNGDVANGIRSSAMGKKSRRQGGAVRVLSHAMAGGRRRNSTYRKRQGKDQ